MNLCKIGAIKENLGEMNVYVKKECGDDGVYVEKHRRVLNQSD